MLHHCGLTVVSVSSNLRINSPSSSFAYWPLITNPREWPKERGPLGFGAKRKQVSFRPDSANQASPSASLDFALE